jgi:hypothetical protein
MARTSIEAGVTAESVWEVLADPRLYGNWVVGASTIREVVGRWPEVGSELHHIQALVLRDTTTVLECEPHRRLVLEARVRPFLVARVALELEPVGERTIITMDEVATGGVVGLVPQPVTDVLLTIRNRETLVRLKRLSEIGAQLGRSGQASE